MLVDFTLLLPIYILKTRWNFIHDILYSVQKAENNEDLDPLCFNSESQQRHKNGLIKV